MSDTNYDEDYSELTIVQRMHELPHLDSSLNSQSKEFDITYEEQWNGYTRSLLTLPIICGSMGVLLVVLLQFYLFFSLFAKGSKARETRASFADLISTIILICITIGALIAAQIVLFGNAELDRGVSNLKDGLNYAEDTFIELTNSGYILIKNGNNVLKQLETAAGTGCSEVDTLNEFIAEYIDSVEDYLKYVEPVPGQVSFYHDGVDRWLVSFKNNTIWVLYAVMMITIGLLFCGGVLKFSCFTTLGYILGQPLSLVYFAIVTVTMIALVSFNQILPLLLINMRLHCISR